MVAAHKSESKIEIIWKKCKSVFFNLTPSKVLNIILNINLATYYPQKIKGLFVYRPAVLPQVKLIERSA